MSAENVLCNILEYDLIPYDKIKNEDYLPAFQYAASKAKKEINELTPENFTIENFEKASDLFEQLKIIYKNLRRINSLSTENLHHEEIDKLLNEFEMDIYMSKDIYNKVQKIKPKNTEEEYLLKSHMRNFLENGMCLPDNEEGKKNLERLKEIKIKMSAKISEYESNLVKGTDAFKLFLEDDSTLKEMPETVKNIAKETAKNNGHENGYCFTLQFPSFGPFMKYCSDRELRKKMYLKKNSVCYKDEFSNVNLVSDIVELRQEKAKILGFNNYNEYVLSNRMAKNENEVEKLENDLKEKAMPFAKKDYEELLKFANEYNENNSIKKIEKMELWDVSYYSDKQIKKLYDIDTEKLREYFPLKKVFKILFELLNNLYDIDIKEENNIKLYHEDLIIFSINSKEQIPKKLGYLYFDLFPRKEKTMGGWVYSLRPKINNKLPIVGIIANNRRSVTNKIEDTFLSLYETETIFHECGHALHIILTETKFRSISGINVLWDFVEVPSQLNENFIYEKLILKKFNIDDDLINRIIKFKNYHEAIGLIGQISYGIVDIKMHSGIFKKETNIEEFEKKYSINILERPDGIARFVSFSHIFNAVYDYSCGYYSYLWAEVLAIDAYDEFHKVFENDKIDEIKKIEELKKVATRYKNCILKKGGSENPEKMFIDFKGRKYSIEPFLKNKGLV